MSFSTHGLPVIGKLADLHARNAEMSMVSSETRRKINAIADQFSRDGSEITEDELLEAVVDALTTEELRGIVGDWMRLHPPI